MSQIINPPTPIRNSPNFLKLLPDRGLELCLKLGDGLCGARLVLKLHLKHIKGFLASRIGDLDDRVYAVDNALDIVRVECFLELLKDQGISARVAFPGRAHDDKGSRPDAPRNT